MDIAVSEDQVLLRDVTRRFLSTASPVGAVRREIDESRGWDAEVWAEAVALGWLAPFIPQRLDGVAEFTEGVVDATIIAEELGRVVSSLPFRPTALVAFALAEFGTAAQQDRWLTAIAKGHASGTWCFAGRGPHAGIDAGGLQITLEEGRLAINGMAAFVETADTADVLIVSGRNESRVVNVLLPAGSPGIEIRSMQSLDLARPLFEVSLSGVQAEPDAIVGTAHRGDETFERLLQAALVLQCAETVGVTDRAFEFTLDWVRTRHAFGRPIGSFQALKHRLADHVTQLEGAKAAAAHAARSVHSAAPDAAVAVSVAKSQCGRAAVEILRDCLQMHGGIGMTWEHDIHLYLRRAVANEALWGSPARHHERLCRLAGL